MVNNVSLISYDETGWIINTVVSFLNSSSQEFPSICISSRRKISCLENIYLRKRIKSERVSHEFGQIFITSKQVIKNLVRCHACLA